MLRNSRHFPGSPVQKALDMAVNVQCPMGKHVAYLDSLREDPVEHSLRCHSEAVAASATSRRVAYRQLNPSLSVHRMYSHPTLPERERVSTTRIRLGSHYLKVETGRWSRMPRDERLCPCGSIQDECHVLTECMYTVALRLAHNLDFSSPATLMNGDPTAVTSYCHNVLSTVYALP